MKITLAGVTAAILLVLTLPPLAVLAGQGRVSWPQLAEIGQAYGGVAAMISALALVGVAASLLLQWRQTRLQQMFALRQHHFDLLKLGMEQPGLLHRDGYIEDPEAKPALGYANMWVALWALQWDLRVLDEAHLRWSAAPLFRRNPVTIQWWRGSAGMWSTVSSARRRRFQAIMTELCETAADELAATCTDR